jgi:hypothetical protein
MNKPTIIPPYVPRWLRAKFHPVSAAKSTAQFAADVYADIDVVSTEQLARGCRPYWQSEVVRRDTAAQCDADRICVEDRKFGAEARAATDSLLAMRWYPTREWMPPEDGWFFLIRFVGKGEKGAMRNSLVCYFIDNLFKRECARAFLMRIEQRLSAAAHKK